MGTGLAEEMSGEIDAFRDRRHDFINHVQIMVALLFDCRKEELAEYVKTIRAGYFRPISETVAEAILTAVAHSWFIATVSLIIPNGR